MPVNAVPLLNGLGATDRLVTRGYGSATGPPGPIRSGVLTRGLGVSQRLVTRGLGATGEVVFPDDLPQAIGEFITGNAALGSSGLSVWADAKPRGVDLPVLLVKVPDGVRFAGDIDTDWLRLNPSLHVLASGKVESARLGAIVEASLKGQTFQYRADGAIRTGQLWIKNIRRARETAEVISGNEKAFRHVIEFECFEFRPKS